jgi:ArsR family transcriptional regulator, arsenate/arsenite/antimonite-responsive transcriptional repressor / arsenate reductase (thioredoxin)
MAAVSSVELLRLVTDGVRWRLLEELSRSDRRVQELVELVGGPQNLVSYHLGRLRKAGLVRERRSSADARDVYYRVDLDRFTAVVCDAASAVQPTLALGRPAGAGPDRATPPGQRVLFVCTGNSTRSQMAEAFARRLGAGRVRPSSAGVRPRPVHPLALRALEELGLDTRGLRSKPLGAVADGRFDCLVTLCDRAREACPDDLVDAAEAVHWSIPDPAEVEGPDDVAYVAFQETAVDIGGRVRHLLARLGRERSEVPSAAADGG